MREPDFYDGVHHAPIGWLGIKLSGGKLCQLDWIKGTSSVRRKYHASPVIINISVWLDNYFSGTLSVPVPPLKLCGTPFQLRVWRALQKIPQGEVRTYGQLAMTLKTGSRAIGQACRANPVSIIVPCHRIVSINGLGGYNGASGQLHYKRWLLHHEGCY